MHCWGWHWYLVWVDLPHLFLLLDNSCASLKTRRLTGFSLSCLTCDSSCGHVRLGRELTSWLLICLLEVLRLSIVMSGEVWCNWALMVMRYMSNSLSARASSAILSLSMCESLALTSAQDYAKHLMRSILWWMVDGVSPTRTVIHLRWHLLLSQIFSLLKPVVLVLLIMRGLLSHRIIRLSEEVILLDLVAGWVANLGLIPLQVRSFLAFRLCLRQANRSFLLLLLLSLDLLLIHSSKLFSSALDEGVRFKTIKVLRMIGCHFIMLCLSNCVTFLRFVLLVRFVRTHRGKLFHSNLMGVQVCPRVGVFDFLSCGTCLHRRKEMINQKWTLRESKSKVFLTCIILSVDAAIAEI